MRQNFREKSYSESVCETSPVSRVKKERVSLTLDERTTEVLNVLAEFGDQGNFSLSLFVNEILYAHVNDPSMETKIAKAYREWKRTRP